MLSLPKDILYYIANIADDYSRHYLMRTCKTYAALIPFKYPNFLRLPYYAELYDSESFRVISNKIKLPETCYLWKVEAYVDRGEYEKINISRGTDKINNVIYPNEPILILGTIEMYIAIRYMIKNHIHQYDKIYSARDLQKTICMSNKHYSEYDLISYALSFRNYKFIKWLGIKLSDIYRHYINDQTLHTIDYFKKKIGCVCETLDDEYYNKMYCRSAAGYCNFNEYPITIDEKIHWCIINNDIDRFRKLQRKYPEFDPEFTIPQDLWLQYSTIKHYRVSDEIMLACISDIISMIDVILHISIVHCSVNVVDKIRKYINTNDNSDSNSINNSADDSWTIDDCYLLELATLANNIPVMEYLIRENINYGDSVKIAIDTNNHEALLMLHKYAPDKFVQDILDNL